MKPMQQRLGHTGRGSAVVRGVALGVAPVEEQQQRRRTRPGRIFKSPPHITYTVSKREVTPEDLLRLYSLCACRDPATQSGSYPRRSHWRHWTQPADEEVLQKLRMALHNSVAIAAAFTRDPRITDDYASDDDDYPTGGSSRSDTGSEASASSGGSGSGGGLWTFGGGGEGALAGWPAPLRELGSSLFGQRRPPRLVGFARAAGDYSLVATVHDVAIHPELQGFGIGARLMKKVVTQVHSSEVYDVGLVTPSELQPFFRGCSFDLDREESVPMVLRGVEAGQRETARVAGNGELKRLLREL